MRTLKLIASIIFPIVIWAVIAVVGGSLLWLNLAMWKTLATGHNSSLRATTKVALLLR